MNAWPKYPLVYEINTWVWLGELSRTYQQPVNLATVPELEWEAIATLGFDAVWFMGVWERSPAGLEISMHNAGLLQDFHRALPDFTAADNVGSPYCVRRYVVAEHLGGTSGLAAARARLAARGLRLILDFVPNDVAPDHPWELVRFIENHDEPRAAAAFTPERHRAAAVTALTPPGARLIHEGQMEGRRVRLPVFLARRPEESPDSDLSAFYRRLLETLSRGRFLAGEWRLCERIGWPDNASYLNLVSWCWRTGEARCLIVGNLSDRASQGLVKIPWDDLAGRTWQLRDAFTAAVYQRDGEQIRDSGLYVDLPAWGCHLLEWR